MQLNYLKLVYNHFIFLFQPFYPPLPSTKCRKSVGLELSQQTVLNTVLASCCCSNREVVHVALSVCSSRLCKPEMLQGFTTQLMSEDLIIISSLLFILLQQHKSQMEKLEVKNINTRLDCGRNFIFLSFCFVLLFPSIVIQYLT